MLQTQSACRIPARACRHDVPALAQDVSNIPTGRASGNGRPAPASSGTRPGGQASIRTRRSRRI